MRKGIRNDEAGVGKAVTFLAVLVLLVAAVLALKLTNGAAPTITAPREIRGIGVSTPVEVRVHDARYRIKSVTVEIRQDPALMRPTDEPANQADVSRLRALGYTSSFPFERTIADSLEFWRQE